MSNNEELLFSDFSPVTSEIWKNKIISDIKGADYNKRMVWKTLEGFDVQPFYTSEHLDNVAYLDSLPGTFPFVRGKRTHNSWYIRQDIEVQSIEQANKKALTLINKGVTSLGFIIHDGNIFTEKEIEILLTDINIQEVEINFVLECGKTHLLNSFFTYCTNKGVEKSTVQGSINIDYLGNLVLQGIFCHNNEQLCNDTVNEVAVSSREFCKFRTCDIRGDYFHNAGASLYQELSFALSQGVEYLTRAVKAGISVREFTRKMQFRFSVGTNYFMEIAKLRAARYLWAKIVEQYNPQCSSNCCNSQEKKCCGESDNSICWCAGKMNIHSITSLWNKSMYDSYINMLRSQTEAMSAILGGCDSLTILPYNSIQGETNEFSERIARNQQLLLKEECRFDAICDPAAGSYYIEQLTDFLIEKSWDLFLQIENKGGFVEAFKHGFIQQIIENNAEILEKNISSRRSTVLGLNQYPNFNETIQTELNEVVFAKQYTPHPQAIAKPITLFRGPQAIEQLRYITDRWAAKNYRPTVFMFTIGNIAMRNARSQF
ncbi:MAG: methylmalonyl-CoA mutase subunit beta, partial [Bacteroidales bacterium]